MRVMEGRFQRWDASSDALDSRLRREAPEIERGDGNQKVPQREGSSKDPQAGPDGTLVGPPFQVSWCWAMDEEGRLTLLISRMICSYKWIILLEKPSGPNSSGFSAGERLPWADSIESCAALREGEWLNGLALIPMRG